MWQKVARILQLP
uniref:Uncharacterized protein n=1 Tax=Rhizophora mucronata TaxID=61149 RepID=A0A2P2QBZ1_RHIMU